MNETNKSSSENKSGQSSNGLTYAKMFVALSLLMVVFILALACNYYISGSQRAYWGVIHYEYAIYLFPLYFFGIVLRKIWSFYISVIAYGCWAAFFLIFVVLLQHLIFFFDEELGSVSFIEFEMKLLTGVWLWGLSVVVLLIGLIGSSKLLEKKYGRKILECRGRKPISLLELLIIVAIVGFLMGVLLPALSKVRNPSDPMKCGTNLQSLGKAIRFYSEQFDGSYPPPDKWCDMLKEYCEVSSEQFKCPQDKKSNCSFTLNPSCEPNSPPDTVFLFESIGGWNSVGGQELLKPRHQRRKGCNILFNDGHCAFVKTEDIPNLNWGQKR